VTERWGDPLALARPPLAEMAQQVQAIGALENLRRPCRRATGVIWGAVAGHDFHAWMSTPPCCHRVGRALGQESHRPRLCELDQHHALDATCAERNIIDAQHTGGSP
jgi:hypothetical protein